MMYFVSAGASLVSPVVDSGLRTVFVTIHQGIDFLSMHLSSLSSHDFWKFPQTLCTPLHLSQPPCSVSWHKSFCLSLTCPARIIYVLHHYLLRVSVWETPSGDSLSQAPPIDSWEERKYPRLAIGPVWTMCKNDVSDGGWVEIAMVENPTPDFGGVPSGVILLGRYTKNSCLIVRVRQECFTFIVLVRDK